LIFQRRIHATDDELSAYLDGRLAPGVRERVGGHVDGCAICRQALDGLRAVQTSLRGLRAKAPRSFALREAAARPVRARAAGGLWGAMPLLSGVTAMAMIAFFAVVSFDMSGGDFGSTNSKKVSSGYNGLSAASVDDASAPMPGAADTAAPVASEASMQSEQRLTVTASGAAQSLTVTLTASLLSGSVAGTPVEPTLEPAKSASSGTGSDARMHVAEAALAAVALVSGGSAVAVARRRRI
jgi:hypothetical protein